MSGLKNIMEAASGRIKADLVLKNPFIVDVFSQNIFKGDIAIVNGEIAGIGRYSGENEMDFEGLYVTPAFIDSHVHVESSKVIPEVFSRALIKKGVTACIADPHEIANVLGVHGIRFMLESGRRSAIDIYFMMPSCVPAVEFEDNGAVLTAQSFLEFKNEKEVLGLGEVMDVSAVLCARDSMMEKIALFKDRVIDGHCPQLSGEPLNAYIYSGIMTDHECSTPEQALEEVRKGMYVMLREGSAARNLKELISAVNDKNYNRFLFCTDDRDITDIEGEGSIDNNIRTAIRCGMNPVMAVTIGSRNAAECYGLRDRGAVAPGFIADLVVLDNLKDFNIKHVIRKGRVYEDCEQQLTGIMPGCSMNISYVNKDMFKIKAEGALVNVIKVRKGSIETETAEREPDVEKGFVKGIKSQDAVKIGVFERHKNTGKYAMGFIEGLGFSGCSIAQTIAHDSHNIIVAGDDDCDMAAAVNRVIEMGGGIAVASCGKIVGELALPVAGLMTTLRYESVIEKLHNLDNTIKKYLKEEDINLIVTLSFMSLPVIPWVKITARGLYDFGESRFISLFKR